MVSVSHLELSYLSITVARDTVTPLSPHSQKSVPVSNLISVFLSFVTASDLSPSLRPCSPVANNPACLTDPSPVLGAGHATMRPILGMCSTT